MIIRALSSLKTDLGPVRTEPESESLARPKAIERPSKESAEKTATKIAKPKKSESLNDWPDQENDEVETFNLSKKS